MPEKGNIFSAPADRNLPFQFFCKCKDERISLKLIDQTLKWEGPTLHFDPYVPISLEQALKGGAKIEHWDLGSLADILQRGRTNSLNTAGNCGQMSGKILISHTYYQKDYSNFFDLSDFRIEFIGVGQIEEMYLFDEENGIIFFSYWKNQDYDNWLNVRHIPTNSLPKIMRTQNEGLKDLERVTLYTLDRIALTKAGISNLKQGRYYKLGLRFEDDPLPPDGDRLIRFRFYTEEEVERFRSWVEK